MNDTPPTSKALNIALWVAQLLLAAAFGLFGSMKASQPLDQLAVMMKWIPNVPPLFVRTLGTLEVLGAIGIILPALTRIKPRLTILAAACFVLVQVCAIILHVSRGELAVIFPLNIILITLAAFVVWGRSKKSVILPRG
jgi:uncharacterized membrane protein YphA (DoxX/SURF4 family)